MKKLKYFLVTGMVLASVALAGCGKKSEDDITNKEIYQDDLQPLTEEELEEMDADTSDEDMKQIAVDVKESAYAIIKAKKATYYGIGMVLARLTRAILFDENSIFTVSAYLKGEYGQRGIYIGVPAVVNRNGVREVLQMDLNEEEKAKFAASADVIHEMIEEIGMDRG